jgi:DNA invertase Pin-like site-specific DNA recombinase
MNQKKNQPKNDTLCCIYSRVSSNSQNNERQILNLKQIAQERGWEVRRIFQEKVSGTVKADSRPEFKKMIQYLESTGIKLVLISEVSRIGRRVVDVLNNVEMLHQQGVGLYIQQFNIITYQGGREDPVAKMLLQMLSIGAEMENSLRRIRQMEGIQVARINNKYSGRKKGATTRPKDLLRKYSDVVDLLEKSDLSLRRVSQITNRSINTVRKVNEFVKISGTKQP